jgi:hypothetical protein
MNEKVQLALKLIAVCIICLSFVAGLVWLIQLITSS